MHKKLNLEYPSALVEVTKVLLKKNKTSVISRGFNHQSKNEQSIKLLFVVKIPFSKKFQILIIGIWNLKIWNLYFYPK
ncbi:hypothetical protein SAMN05444372_10957 [Flavobacterium micromati]|uniref:Uncharacterized protein n=1 Tax=Flavobacterium micromati TaxID=229205 RepID=A0A1M5M5L9_9FLAO|nr:hypothetical protein SAMN05444372_10957 [Flavobacterium micromati]